MLIQAGYDITYQCPQPTPMLLALSVHPSRMADVQGPHEIVFDPPIGASEYRDGFGNICHRIVAPAGSLRISTKIVVSDPGIPDAVVPEAIHELVAPFADPRVGAVCGRRSDRAEGAAEGGFGLGKATAGLKGVAEIVVREGQ